MSWQKEGRTLSRSGGPRYSIISEGRLLILLGVEPEDNGEYICIARNEAGEVANAI